MSKTRISATATARSAFLPVLKKSQFWTWLLSPVHTSCKCDATTLFLLQNSQESWAQLKCCKLFVVNLWRQHSHRICRKYEPGCIVFFKRIFRLSWMISCSLIIQKSYYHSLMAVWGGEKPLTILSFFTVYSTKPWGWSLASSSYQHYSEMKLKKRNSLRFSVSRWRHDGTRTGSEWICTARRNRMDITTN